MAMNSENSRVSKENEKFDYLEKRKGLIDGLCISGGEPLLHNDIELFIKKVKEKMHKIQYRKH